MKRFTKKKGGSIDRCQCTTSIGNRCKNKVDHNYKIIVDGKEVENNYFCNYHIKRLKSFSEYFRTLKDSELYSPQLWNDMFGIQFTHNCYSYAINQQVKSIKDACESICFKSCKDKNKDNCRNNKSCKDKNKDNCRNKKSCRNLQSKCSKWKPQPGRYRKIMTSEFTCPDMVYRTIADNPKTYITSFKDECIDNYRKIAVVVNPKDGYHYYKEDRSHTGINPWSDKPGSTKTQQKDASNVININPLMADRDYAGTPYSEFCNFLCTPTGPKNMEYKPNKDLNLN